MNNIALSNAHARAHGRPSKNSVVDESTRTITSIETAFTNLITQLKHNLNAVKLSSIVPLFVSLKLVYWLTMLTFSPCPNGLGRQK